MRLASNRSVSAVYDWDSLTILREPALAGGVAHLFTSDFRVPARVQLPTLDEALAFVAAYEAARGGPFGGEEYAVACAALTYDGRFADEVTRVELDKIGIELRDTSQPVSTLSGGERQCVAIARAVYFGAKVLILDEPTSALGVRQSSIVLRYIDQTRAAGIGVIFITHNVHHAYLIGDRFTVLERGRNTGTSRHDEISVEQLEKKMAGGKELERLASEFQRAKATV
jgi:simple sugar transport system ATP-binding protein